MLDIIKRFFDKVTPEDHKDPKADAGHDVQVATCALFLEMARIDESFTKEETDAILSILKEKYGLHGSPV